VSDRVDEHQPPVFRAAQPEDAPAVAHLHADSWRRHYRGAYSDAYLDGDVLADRTALWTERLRTPEPRSVTILAEQDGLVGFTHLIFEEDPQWGALLENLHVQHDRQRAGLGGQLLALSAAAVLARPGPSGLYLWVLEQNRPARAFYEACGGGRRDRTAASPPGGIPARLTGTPMRLRYAWPDVACLTQPTKPTSR
jgi:GNAT superfamily N-acetyltransferase